LLSQDSDYMKRAVIGKKAATSFSVPPRPVTQSVGSITDPTPSVEALTIASRVGTRDFQVLNIPPISIIPSSNTTAIKKKKGRVDASSSEQSPKRSHHNDALGSLVGVLLSEDLCLGDKVSYHLSLDVKEFIKEFSGVEALPMTHELILRLTVLTSRFPMSDQSQVEALQKELTTAWKEQEELKTSATNMSKQFQQLALIKYEHVRCMKRERGGRGATQVATSLR